MNSQMINKNSQLAYAKSTGLSSNIYLHNLSDNTTQSLTKGIDWEGQYSPSWSPDGTSLAWLFHNAKINHTELRIRRLDSGSERYVPLKYFDGGIFWSPDSRYLCYGDKPIRLFEVSTGIEIALESSRNFGGIYSWSPDGKYLLTKGINGEFFDLALISIQDDTAHYLSIFQQIGGFSNITWTDNNVICCTGWFAKQNTHLYSVLRFTLDGKVTQLMELDASYHCIVGLSHDGEQLAFFKYVGIPITSIASNPDGKGDFYIVNADSTQQRKLLENVIPGVRIVWSPDKSRIVYETNMTQRMYVVSTIQGSEQLIGEKCFGASWRP